MNYKRKDPAHKSGADVLLASGHGLNNNQAEQLQPLSLSRSCRRLKVDIHKTGVTAQDRASKATHGDARSLLWMVAQVADQWTFLRVPDECLSDVSIGLHSLLSAAGRLEVGQ